MNTKTHIVPIFNLQANACARLCVTESLTSFGSFHLARLHFIYWLFIMPHHVMAIVTYRFSTLIYCLSCPSIAVFIIIYDSSIRLCFCSVSIFCFFYAFVRLFLRIMCIYQIDRYRASRVRWFPMDLFWWLWHIPWNVYLGACRGIRRAQVE